MSDPNKCNPDVFARGVSLGLYAIKKDEAESLCAALRAAFGAIVDWHYIGGRVHIKMLPVEHKVASHE